MNKSLLVGVLVLVAMLAGAIVWLLQGEAGAPLPGPVAPAGAGAPLEPAPGDAAKAKAAVEPADAPLERTSVAAGRTAVSTGFAIVGIVVDADGLAVPGATVSCMTAPDFAGGRGGFDWAGFDPADFDPTAMVEQLRARAQERAQVSTDALGHFRLVPEAGGRQVMLRVAARGHRLLDRQAAPPSTADVDLGTLTLQRGAIVSGRVVDRQGAPVAGATVSRQGRGEPGFAGFDFDFPGSDVIEQLRDGDGGVSDAGGRFELQHMAPGSFSLRARHPDHPTARKDGLEVAAGQQLTDVLVEMAPGATIRGRVLDLPAETSSLRVQATARPAGNGTPPDQADGMAQLLGDARDMLADAGMAIGDKVVELGSDGSFEFRGLQVDQTYRLLVAQSGRGFVGNGACSETKDVAAGSVGVELRYDPGITVTCRVVDAASKAPVERLWVGNRLMGGDGGGLERMLLNAMPSSNRAKDYPDGRVTLTNLRPKAKQTLRLTIEAIGFAAFERQDIAMPASGNVDLGTIELRSTPVVRVQVTAADGGQPVAGAMVQIRQAQGQTRGGRGRRGAGAGAGEDAFAAAMEAFGGRGAGGGGTHSARTDAAGRCVLNAAAGASTLSVTSRQHAPWQADVTVAADRDLEQRVLLLIGGTVTVQVRDADGAPLARAGVEHAPPAGRRGSDDCDAEGKVVFEHLAPGVHRFRIRERGGRGGMDLAAMAEQFGQRGGDDRGWQDVEVVDAVASQLQLQKSATAMLHGIVRQNGAPLSGASITFLTGPASGADSSQDLLAGGMAMLGGRGRGGRNGRSGADGSYSLRELPAGQHRLRVQHQGRSMPTTLEVTLRLGDNVFDIDLAMTTLRGTVRGPDGNPVADATVTVRPAGSGDGPLAQMPNMPGVDLGALTGEHPVRTGEDGRYELRGVAAGVQLVVSATAKGMARSASAPVELQVGAERDGVDIALGAAGSIKVTASGGGFMQMARATFVPADGSVDDAAPVMQMLRRGSGTFDGLRPGRWKVVMAGAGGDEGDGKIVEVVAGETATVAF